MVISDREKIYFDHYVTPYQKHLEGSEAKIKFLEQNVEEQLYYLGIGRLFTNSKQKVLVINEKNLLNELF